MPGKKQNRRMGAEPPERVLWSRFPLQFEELGIILRPSLVWQTMNPYALSATTLCMGHEEFLTRYLEVRQQSVLGDQLELPETKKVKFPCLFVLPELS